MFDFYFPSGFDFHLIINFSRYFLFKLIKNERFAERLNKRKDGNKLVA